MANLSNINNILRTGSLGVGINRDPLGAFEISSATKPGVKMFNTSTNGKTYEAYSDTNGNYIIYDQDADDNRFVINTSGNATFAGQVIASSSSSGDYVRMYGGSGTAQWDIYGNGENLRFSENSGGGGHVDIDTNLIVDGNVGIGITPNVNSNVVNVIQLGKGMTLLGNVNDDRATMAANLYLDTGTAFRYVMDGYAGRFSIEDGNMIWSTAGSGTAGSVATVDTKMTLLNNGNVGIGTTAPNSRLTVQAVGSQTTQRAITIFHNNTLAGGYASIGAQYTATNGYIDSEIRFGGETLNGACSFISFATGCNNTITQGPNSERMRINSSGNVGIGTTSPTSPTSVARFLEISGATAGIVLHDSDVEAWDLYASGGKLGTRYNNGANGWWLDSSGRMGIGTTSPPSDHRLQIHNAGFAYSRFALTNSSTGVASGDGLIFQMETLNSIIKNQENGFLAFGTNGRETDLFIKSDGNIGIGTNSPQENLEIHDATMSTISLSYEGGSGNGSSIDFNLRPSSAIASPLTSQIKATDDGAYRQNISFSTKTSGTASSGQTTRMMIKGDGNVGIGTTSPAAKLDVAGDITIQNGLYTYKTQGYTAGSSAINVDITVGNEGGAGNVFKIEAGFAHYYGMSYNSIGEWWCTSRGTTVINTYILNAGTSNAGTWSSSKPNNTTLRVTKSAGTYAGGGKWWIKVTYVPF